MAATIPADLSQYYYNVIQISQKLVFLYGWPELFTDDNQFDDETLMQLTLFIGVMLGSIEASKAVSEISKRVALELTKRLPQKALK